MEIVKQGKHSIMLAAHGIVDQVFEHKVNAKQKLQFLVRGGKWYMESDDAAALHASIDEVAIITERRRTFCPLGWMLDKNIHGVGDLKEGLFNCIRQMESMVKDNKMKAVFKGGKDVTPTKRC